jgi:hypothetical protein
MKEKTQTLDLRLTPPFERPEKIFEIWETLKGSITSLLKFFEIFSS